MRIVFTELPDSQVWGGLVRKGLDPKAQRPLVLSPGIPTIP